MTSVVPSVSAVIPTRNRPELVCRAVRSVLAQSYVGLEAVVVIDGPDAATREALAALDDPRLRTLELENSVGAAEARNLGVKNARGEWVAFLDDDDEWLPAKIEAQMQRAKGIRDRRPILCCRLIGRTPSRDAVMPEKLYSPDQPLGDYLFCRDGFSNSSGFIQTSSIVAPKDMLLSVPFRSGLKRHQDWDWLLRAAHLPGVEIVMLPEPLAIFYMEDNRDSISRTLDWEFSLNWADELGPLISRRAYSHFVCINCVLWAAHMGSGVSGYTKILRAALTKGQFSAGALIRFFAYSVTSRASRQQIRKVFGS